MYGKVIRYALIIISILILIEIIRGLDIAAIHLCYSDVNPYVINCSVYWVFHKKNATLKGVCS